MPDARFLGIVLPRVLQRLPYGHHDRRRIDGFAFREEISTCGDELLWGNAAFAFAGMVLRAFSRSGWPMPRCKANLYDGGTTVSGLRGKRLA